mmetsp:Transcript_3764/g.7212  ORF Transcript_3764/g.7212 Transcript_3764/m.7212 type:complete len:241 (+) Transcript_3764:435-1157(+)
MRMEDRPTSTKSCGNDLISFTGELGLSSPESYPPGSCCTVESKSHMPTAAGPSSAASGLNSTPSSIANFPINSKSAGLSSLSRSAKATMILQRVSRLRPEICLTCPKSMSPIRPSSNTKIFPGCGSAWKNPVSKILRPKHVVNALNSFRPKSLAWGESGSMPRSSIFSRARLSGTPCKKSCTKTRLDTKPGTGRGKTSGMSRGRPSGVKRNELYTRSMATASATKSNSSCNCFSSSEKTV